MKFTSRMCLVFYQIYQPSLMYIPVSTYTPHKRGWHTITKHCRWRLIRSIRLCFSFVPLPIESKHPHTHAFSLFSAQQGLLRGPADITSPNHGSPVFLPSCSHTFSPHYHIHASTNHKSYQQEQISLIRRCLATSSRPGPIDHAYLIPSNKATPINPCSSFLLIYLKNVLLYLFILCLTP